jgi:beta-ketoacyl-acyl-carrier-protein synthase II
MVHGRSGIGPITFFDSTPFAGKIQAETKDFSPDPRIDAKQLRNMSRSAQFALTAAFEALDDSGLAIDESNADMVGITVASGGGGLELITHYEHVLAEKGPRRVTPFLVANLIVDAASGHIAIATGARGPNLSPVAACATGVVGLGEGFETIRRGDADAMLAGGSDAPLIPVLHAVWNSMRALAGDNDHPEKALKPFDLNRDGFVAGEGAAVFVLEELEQARARGATIYCEVIGYASGNDAFDMIQLREDGAGLRRAVTHAVRKADIDPAEIDYINPHGSGTPLNDRVETRVFKDIMGDAAYRASVSSVKPIVGHAMGAAGAIEAMACVLAIRDQCVPPTINYETPDPDCDLDYVPNEAKQRDVRVALATSVGLGGHNAAILFRAVDENE